MPQISDAEYARLKKAAAASDSQDIEDIAKRPYHRIYASDGMQLTKLPGLTSDGGEGGPWTLNGQHPDDFYAAEEQDDGKGGKKYVATQNAGDAPKKSAGAKGALPDDFPGKSALDAAGLTTYAKVRDYGDLTDVAGIGSATAAKIQDRLAADAAGGN